MKKFLASLVLVCAMATTVYAGPAEGTYFSSGVTNTTPAFDAYGTVVRPIGGGPVNMLTVASGVTTNTSSTPVAGVSGIKNFQWVITGTGSITQTAALKGSFASGGSNAETLCTITLSGTTTTFGTCDPFTAPFPYLFVTTTNTTGTGTSGTGKLGY